MDVKFDTRTWARDLLVVAVAVALWSPALAGACLATAGLLLALAPGY